MVFSATRMRQHRASPRQQRLTAFTIWFTSTGSRSPLRLVTAMLVRPPCGGVNRNRSGQVRAIRDGDSAAALAAIVSCMIFLDSHKSLTVLAFLAHRALRQERLRRIFELDRFPLSARSQTQGIGWSAAGGHKILRRRTKGQG